MIRSHQFPELDEAFPPLNPNPTGAASANDKAQNFTQRLHADRLVSPRISLRTLPKDAGGGSLADVVAQLGLIHRHLYHLSAPWVIQPPDSESFHVTAGIAIPAQDLAFHPVVTLIVPPGRSGVLNKIGNEFVGGGFQDFSGNIVWQIVRNSGSGITTAERNYENIQASLGTPQQPGTIAGIRLFENDVIQLVVKNVGIAPAGQLIGGLLGGWFYPSIWDEGY